jgi:hypothetical protein
MQLADDLAGGNVQRGEQRGRAMTHAVVGASLGIARGQRQDGLCAVQRLDLALLIDTQTHSLDGWCQVQTNDVAHLLHDHLVAGEFERVLAVRLQAKCGSRPSAIRPYCVPWCVCSSA